LEVQLIVIALYQLWLSLMGNLFVNILPSHFWNNVE